MMNIKFKVFDEHLNEMKEMTLEDFEREFTSIYGNYCMVVNNEGYPCYFPDELIYSDIEISELIDSHLNSLVFVVENISKYDAFFITYVENSFTWLSIKKEGNTLQVSEISKYYTQDMNKYFKGGYVLTNKKFFNEVEVIWGPVSISVDEFIEEVISATQKLVKIIGGVNTQFLRSRVMNKMFDFVERMNINGGI
ncbi:MAG: hypothetical protein FH761_11325 [Firmicutes bacterium]|nr:hypothetical protein [Bacillota bacterium]